MRRARALRTKTTVPGLDRFLLVTVMMNFLRNRSYGAVAPGAPLVFLLQVAAFWRAPVFLSSSAELIVKILPWRQGLKIAALIFLNLFG